MTPEYVYEEMTWAETSAALEYVALYETDDRHRAAREYVKNKPWRSWFFREDDIASAKKITRLLEDVRREQNS